MGLVRPIVLLILLAGHAAAEPLVLASPDPAFRIALEAALSPAGLSVIVASDAVPPSINDIASSSRKLADREQATSTVWLLFGGDGATLVTYDRGVDRVLVRSVPYASPLSSAQAAEAARMVRTMLRALRVTPDTNLPPPPASEAAAVRAAAAIEPGPKPAIASPALLALDLDVGVRVRGAGATTVPSGAVTVIVRPDALGLAVTARVAPASDVRGTTFVGRVADDSLAVTARLPLRVAPRLTISGVAGFALHLVRLEGELGTDSIEERRFDPAARIGVAASLAMRPTLGLGVGVSADCLLRRQTYEAGAEQVLAVPLVQLSAAIVFTARIR